MDCKVEVDNLVAHIKDEVTNAGKTGCVVGISGGIDSAVIASLCKLAFPQSTFGVSMPLTTNIDGNTTRRANLLCKVKNIPITLKPIDKDIVDGWDKAITPLNKGNYYARRRMCTLYLHGELHNSLVIGTDNKCESFIGYFTKYGDGGVDMNPLGEYMKSEVFELGEYLKVPRPILDAKPTAELWHAQTDEDELGYSYDDMEFAIKFIEQNCTTALYNLNIVELAREYNMPEDKVKIVMDVAKRHITTKHKRMMPKCYNRTSK